uniref:Small redox-active disulfide protein 2 n=1 Tax=Desulfovibrio sp. U5L TaxID=596152 RepID=I2Q0T6_9BACT
MLIQVLGTGCAKCNELEKLVKAVVAETGGDATVEKVTDLKQIAMMGVFTTPALVIDGVIKAAGGLPAEKDIRAWIA